jgi:hypothetical protein
MSVSCDFDGTTFLEEFDKHVEKPKIEFTVKKILNKWYCDRTSKIQKPQNAGSMGISQNCPFAMQQKYKSSPATTFRI